MTSRDHNSSQIDNKSVIKRIKSQGFENRSESHSRSRTNSPKKDQINTSKTEAHLITANHNGENSIDRTMTFTKIGLNPTDGRKKHEPIERLEFSTFSKKNRHLDSHKSASRNSSSQKQSHSKNLGIHIDSMNIVHNNTPSNLKLKRHFKQASKFTPMTRFFEQDQSKERKYSTFTQTENSNYLSSINHVEYLGDINTYGVNYEMNKHSSKISKKYESYRIPTQVDLEKSGRYSSNLETSKRLSMEFPFSKKKNHLYNLHKKRTLKIGNSKLSTSKQSSQYNQNDNEANFSKMSSMKSYNKNTPSESTDLKHTDMIGHKFFVDENPPQGKEKKIWKLKKKKNLDKMEKKMNTQTTPTRTQRFKKKVKRETFQERINKIKMFDHKVRKSKAEIQSQKIVTQISTSGVQSKTKKVKPFSPRGSNLRETVIEPDSLNLKITRESPQFVKFAKNLSLKPTTGIRNRFNSDDLNDTPYSNKNKNLFRAKQGSLHFVSLKNKNTDQESPVKISQLNSPGLTDKHLNNGQSSIKSGTEFNFKNLKNSSNSANYHFVPSPSSKKDSQNLSHSEKITRIKSLQEQIIELQRSFAIEKDSHDPKKNSEQLDSDVNTVEY